VSLLASVVTVAFGVSMLWKVWTLLMMC